jgi:antitoxin (DNA-binding transcriptional repressor) of toxin-antitoxin stability system
MSTITITEIARNFADYINRVAYRGESFILIRGKKAVAELRPVPLGKKLGEIEHVLKSLPKLSPQEYEDFVRDLKTIRKLSNKETLKDPWESY